MPEFKEEREPQADATEPRGADVPSKILGESQAIREVRTLVQRAAASDATVLILGESGTGKELVARELHVRSSRCSGPFVPCNCAALPEALAESELFGHEKGAFTGAFKQRKGLFEQADGGTLFLDEIGDMPLWLQAKVLRVLQEGKARRLGASQEIKFDVRLVTATHRNLVAMIATDDFREDLYHRISVLRIELPPLRERDGDVELLARAFLAREKPNGEFGDGVIEALRAAPWRGNVRELHNKISSAVVLAAGRARLELSDFDLSFDECLTLMEWLRGFYAGVSRSDPWKDIPAHVRSCLTGRDGPLTDPRREDLLRSVRRCLAKRGTLDPSDVDWLEALVDWGLQQSTKAENAAAQLRREIDRLTQPAPAAAAPAPHVLKFRYQGTEFDTLAPGAAVLQALPGAEREPLWEMLRWRGNPTEFLEEPEPEHLERILAELGDHANRKEVVVCLIGWPLRAGGEEMLEQLEQYSKSVRRRGAQPLVVQALAPFHEETKWKGSTRDHHPYRLVHTRASLTQVNPLRLLDEMPSCCVEALRRTLLNEGSGTYKSCLRELEDSGVLLATGEALVPAIDGWRDVWREELGLGGAK